MRREEEIQKRILKILAGKKVPIHRYYGETVKFGVVSDTHIGSLYEQNELLRTAYNVFRREGITTVYHCGDILEGSKLYRGQEYEVYANGAEQQVQAVVKRYPYRKGITTYFITGNHDLSFRKICGIDIGPLIEIERPDLVYLGQEEADILVGNKKKVIVRLIHPHKGSSYALSYQIQKYIDSLSGGRKPNVLLCGHYHKAEYLPCYRNVFALQGGTLQGQTPFMRGKNLAAHVGFWIVEFKIDDKGSIQRFKPEFFAHYEEEFLKKGGKNGKRRVGTRGNTKKTK